MKINVKRDSKVYQCTAQYVILLLLDVWIFSDESVCRDQISRQQLDKRRFAGTIWANEGDAGVEVQTEVKILRGRYEVKIF